MNRITVCSRIDAKIFKDFAYFDTMRLKKRWRHPALFAALMLFFALLCFSQMGKRDDSVVLGTVLGVIALLLPFSYFYNFNSSLNKQVVKQGITKPRPVYNIELNDDGVIVSNNSEKADFAWDDIYRVYHRNDCVYLYVAESRAFLLPDSEIKCGTDALWELFAKHLSAEKLFR